MKQIKTVIVFDTEFISSKELNQPVEVAFIAYSLEESKLIKLNDFCIYIQTLKHAKVNKFVTRVTGITNKLLDEQGLEYRRARREVLAYLNKFNKNDTLIVGWDIHNDQNMFDKLFNLHFKHRDVNKYRWFDLARVYSSLKKLKGVTSLSKACLTYKLESDNYHDAKEDAIMTSKLLEKLLKHYKENRVFYQFNETKFTKKKK